MDNKYLNKLASTLEELEIAQESKKEEDKAIQDYTDRLKVVKNPVLRKALEHARGEEEEHSKLFSDAINALS